MSHLSRLAKVIHLMAVRGFWHFESWIYVIQLSYWFFFCHNLALAGVWATVPAPLYDVPLQHGLLGHNASEAEAVQVQRFKAPIQDQFCHSTTHCRGLLQAVAAKTGGKVHVVDHGVDTDDAVLIEGVVVIETCPRTRHLRARTRERELRYIYTNLWKQLNNIKKIFFSVEW